MSADATHLAEWVDVAERMLNAPTRHEPTIHSEAIPLDDFQDRLARAGRCLRILQQAWGDDGSSTLPIDERDDEPLGIIGRFEIIRRVGHGAHGFVYLAYDPVLKRKVALKVPRPEMFASSSMRQRFARESESLARLSHPNLVPLYELGTIGPVCFVVQAYIAGPTLKEFIAREGPLLSRDAAQLVVEVARAVAYVHRCGIVHRDIKPGNILLDDRDVGHQGSDAERSQLSERAKLQVKPLLTDFGLAKWLGTSQQLTRATATIGTPAYMAPEQIDSSPEAVGVAADVYAIGATLYEALTGRPPYETDSIWETIRQIKDSRLVPPSLRVAGVPKDLEAICLKCLEYEPLRRYQSAEHLADDMQRYLDHKPILARRIGSVGRLAKWSRRRPLVASLVILCALLLGLGFSATAWQWRTAVNQRELAATNFTLAHKGIRDIYALIDDNHDLDHAAHDDLRRNLRAKVLKYYRELGTLNSGSLQMDCDIAEVCYSLAHTQLAYAEYEAAIELAEHAIARWQAIVPKAPTENNASYYLARSYQVRGLAVARSGRSFDEALEPLRRSQEIFQHLVDRHPSDAGLKSALAESYTAVGSLARLQGQMEFSDQATREALKLRQAAAELAPQDETIQRQLADAYYRRAAHCLRQNQFDEANRLSTASVEILKPRYSAINRHADLGIALVRALRIRATAADRLGESTIADAAREQERESVLNLSQQFPENEWVKRSLAALTLTVDDLSSAEQ